MKNILVCGLYYSGSGAVIDLLSEYAGIIRVQGEFEDIRRAGMLGDYAEGTINANNPSNIEAACKGFWYPVKQNDLTTFYYAKQIVKKIIVNTPLSKIYKSGVYDLTSRRAKLLRETSSSICKVASKDERIDLLKSHISSVADLYRKENASFCLFDQPIFMGAHQEVWPLAFDPFKLIVVYRDPRDQIAQLIKNNLIFFDIETPTRGLLDIYGYNRAGAIRYELDTLKARFKNAKKLQDKFGQDKVKIISFESLVKDYEKQTAQIESFLGLDPNLHKYKRKFFDPKISCKNIGIYKEYLTEKELAVFDSVDILKNYN